MDTSPFATLPAEIRIHIYELAFAGGEPISLTRPETMSTTKLSKAFRQTVEPAFAQTCRQIRHQSALIQFSVNTFSFTQSGPENLHQRFTRVMAKIPVQYAQFLRSVQLSIKPSVCFCECCVHRTKFLRSKMRALVASIRDLCLQLPQYTLVLRFAVCYDRENCFELPMGQSVEVCDRAIESAGQETHYKDLVDPQLGNHQQQTRRRAQRVLRHLKGIAMRPRPA